MKLRRKKGKVSEIEIEKERERKECGQETRRLYAARNRLKKNLNYL